MVKIISSVSVGITVLILAGKKVSLEQWYSTFFVRVPPDVVSLQLCTPKVVWV
jgi:hypothetical protein